MTLVLAPVDATQELMSDGFEWTSDSDEAIGLTLYFGLAGYFTVTEMHLLFPVGDTYKFDLTLYNSLDGTGEPYATVAVRVGWVLESVCESFGWRIVLHLRRVVLRWFVLPHLRQPGVLRGRHRCAMWRLCWMHAAHTHVAAAWRRT